MIQQTKSKPWSCDLHIAGCPIQARHLCQQFVWGHPCCIALQEQLFIYTGGCEAGVVLHLTNYPRFPSTKESLCCIAKALAEHLLVGLHQRTCLLETPTETIWFHRAPLTTSPT